MVEAGFLWASGRVVHWHTPEGATSASLPDDAGLWQAFWSNRTAPDLLFVHTHPGGYLDFSPTDARTIADVERALGRELSWVILAKLSHLLTNVLAAGRAPRFMPYTDVGPYLLDETSNLAGALERLAEISFGGVE